MRVKLIVTVTALVLAALTLIGVVSVLVVRGQLLGNADKQLAALAGIDEVPRANGFVLPSDFVLQLRGPDGALRREIRSHPDPPAIPAEMSARTSPQTVGSWRVLAGEPQPDGDFLVVAMNLAEIDQAIGLLVTIEAIAGGLVVIGLIVVGVNAMLNRLATAFAAQQQSEERMRRFIADASHELRTPISVIRGYAEYSQQDPRQLPATLRKVEAEAIRMGVLVDDLLVLARLDQRKPLERGPVDLLALLGEAVARAEILAPDRDIRLDVAPDAAFLITADESAIRQVVDNLLVNAQKHTPPGTPIDVRLNADGHTAVLEVADHGPGLPDEHAERVFDRFYRVDNGRDRRSGGTGLGLAIVAAQVAAHGGTVGVSTNPGGGAAFRVVLPLDD